MHGANPDCVIIVHDECRKQHKGFEENSDLYKMHPLKRYLKVIESLSLPCGPIYKTVGIATIGSDNIENIKKIINQNEISVSDVLNDNGGEILLEAIDKYLLISQPVNSDLMNN